MIADFVDQYSIAMIAGIFGVTVGMLAAFAAVYLFMPRMMMITEQCSQGVDETVAMLEKSIKEQGWSVQAVKNVTQQIRKHNIVFEPQVRLVELCKAEYAKEVLTDNRDVSCMMPCTFAVWEDNNGNTKLTRMNLGLMAKMFGGTVQRVMGGSVVGDEEKMLSGILK